MVVERQHEIIEIDKMEDLANSYFVRRGIIYSRDCDNNRLNVWIEGTLFENLEIFYHCENEIESTPDKAFDLFEVGRKVLVLHKFIYNGDKVENIERTVIGLKYNSPEGISNLQPCVVKRFFAKIKKVAGESISYSYHWIYIDDEENVTTIEIKGNEDKTETEVCLGMDFLSELEKALYLGDPLLNPLIQSATKSFMMTNDKGFRERWVATPCSLFKDQCEIINVMPQHWTPPLPCDVEELPCPPNRFYCDIEKRILVWYGAYEIFIGATIVRFDSDINYIWNCVAASGFSMGGTYSTILGTRLDIPINMMPDIKSVTDTKISFYLQCGVEGGPPGLVTIDWINYTWSATISAENVENTEHWYWSEEGFTQKACAYFEQEEYEPDVIVENDSFVPVENFNCEDFGPCSPDPCPECLEHSDIVQINGHENLTINQGAGYVSDYSISLFNDDPYSAHTINRYNNIEESKSAMCNHCEPRPLDPPFPGWNCINKETTFGCGASREIGDSLSQKESTGLSATWLSSNVAYYYKKQNRRLCIGDATQAGEEFGAVTGQTGYWGGSSFGEFANDYWWPEGDPVYTTPEGCDGASLGIGKRFKYNMPGPEGDWLTIDRDECEYLGNSPLYGNHYRWIRDARLDEFLTPLIQKFKLDDINFDATETYKTYYLDDRATCHEQGLVIAGKGVKDSKIFWEIYHDGTNITNKIFEALGCEQSELDEIGLI